MTSKVVQDVIPPEKKSIRRIPIPSKSRVTKSEDIEGVPNNSNGGGNNHYWENNHKTKGKGRKPGFKTWLVLGLLLAALVFVFSGALSRAEVKVHPQTQILPIDIILTASKNPGIGEVRFDVIRVSEEISKEVEAGETTEVATRASGEITVFNNYSPADQILVTNTRFETSEGLIYRIQEQITVPGQTTDEEGNVIPGSITVTVYADEPGEEYNISLTDFTIPGFEGSPQFDNFFARSETEMTGGFVGLAREVSDGDLEVALSEIQSELQEELRRKIQTIEIPEEFLIVNDEFFVGFEGHRVEDLGENALVKQTGNLSAILIEKQGLNEQALSGVLPEEELSSDDKIIIRNIEQMRISVEEDFQIERDQSLEFSFSGEAELVWLFDENRLKRDLVGKPFGEFQSIMERYRTTVKEAEPRIRPFWRRSFPRSVENISVEIVLD